MRITHLQSEPTLPEACNFARNELRMDLWYAEPFIERGYEWMDCCGEIFLDLVRRKRSLKNGLIALCCMRVVQESDATRIERAQDTASQTTVPSTKADIDFTLRIFF